ncbi:transposase orfB [Sphingomonas sp. SKA58]|nr:transposase orfB [Sphingomonas sp. SKA58]
MRKWLGRFDVTTFNIEPGSRWENSYIERFNARLRDKAEPVP